MNFVENGNKSPDKKEESEVKDDVVQNISTETVKEDGKESEVKAEKVDGDDQKSRSASPVK